MVRAVLLDVDGTLVDSNDAHADAWHRALSQFGYDVPLERLRLSIGMGGDKILRRIDSSLREDSGKGKAIGELRLEIFLDRVNDLRATKGARELLQRLGSEGIQRIVATSAKENEMGAVLKAAHIEGFIDGTTTSDDAEHSKPDADIVLAAIQLARTTAAQTIFLGDTPYDVEAARRAGVQVVAVECGGWSRAELAGAHAIYADPLAIFRDFDQSLFSLSESDSSGGKAPY